MMSGGTTPMEVDAIQGGKGGKKGDQAKSGISCHRCGGKHSPADCKFLKESCNNCGKVGHISKMCRSKPLESKGAGKGTKGGGKFMGPPGKPSSGKGRHCFVCGNPGHLAQQCTKRHQQP